jgi:alpha-amylase/alpha-mannosidase (GH57 family)
LCGPSRKESDLETYLKEARLDHHQHSDLDILEYWKTNEGKYPELSMIAYDVLSIPITTESTFSIGSRILDKYRSVTLSDNVEALLCTHNWLCETPG